MGRTARVLACALAAIAFLPAAAGAQGCCTPGSSPLGGLSGGSLLRGQVEIGIASEGFSLRQAYLGSTQVDDPAQRESRVLTVLPYVRVGILDRLAFIAQLPFEHRERTAPAIPETGAPQQDFSNTDWADLTTLLMAQVLPWKGIAPYALNLGAGIKWATGPDDNTTDDGLRLPVELQTGTGSTDPVLALVGYYLWSWGSLGANAALRIPTRGDNGYRYGTEVNYAINALWALGLDWQLGAEIRGRSAARDDFRDFVRENTGGTRITVGPRVVYAVPSTPLTVEGAFFLPLYQNMNELQLGVSEGASLGIRWSL